MNVIPYRPLIVVFASLALLAGCSSSGPKQAGNKVYAASTGASKAVKGGGYYLDDGPGSDIPDNLHAIPDAVPRIEAHAPATSKPYRVFGIKYTPKTGSQPFRQKGIASWYGKKFHGNKTANGEIYDMYAMTAAHPTLPIPSYARVTRTTTKQSVIVRINDRGPFHSARIIDLSYAAASKLDLIAPGKGEVVVEAITHDDIAAGKYAAPTQLAAAPPVNTQNQNRAGNTLHTTHVPAAQAAISTAEMPDALQALAATTQAESNSRVFLQFGAFSGVDNARQLAQRLNGYLANEHHSAHIDSSGQLHRVRLGPYPSRTEAAIAATRIQELSGVKATVAVR